MSEHAHSEYIGDKIERAIEVIGEESDDYDEWELRRKYTEGELATHIELRGNYLYVEVEDAD